MSESPKDNPTASPLTAPVALLIAYIMKHQEPQFREAARRIPRLKFLLSTLIESQRDYQPDLDALDITIQKTWTIKKRWRHATGFEDQINVHFPYDTYFQLRRIRPAVVVSYELGARSLFSVLYRILHRKSRLVLAIYVSEHTERSWSRARTLLRKFLLRWADVVTYQGSSGKRYLEGIGVPPAKLYHNPYVAHPAMLYTGSTDRDLARRRRMLYVGQFTERKAPEQFLNALGAWCRQNPTENAEISLVGRGPLKERLETMQHPANLHVTVIGSVAPEKLPGVYAEHGIMVFPTFADEWGLVVDEALHSGLPVLSSIYAQATLDLVRDGYNGWQFTSDDPQNTYQAIDRMMKTPHDELNAYARNGRLSVADRTPDYGGRLLVAAVQAALAK